MHTPNRRLAAAAFAVALLASSAQPHEGDPKILDQVPHYQGPGFRSGTPRVLRDGQAMIQAPLFPASGVQLLSWLPLPELAGGTSGNSCYGYTSPSGREYALIGLRGSTAVVEVSDPGDPHVVAIVPGPVSLWRDVRVWQDHAYAVSEGGDGIQVIDLSGVDNGVVTHVGNVLAGGDLSTHTVFIDETNGFLYRAGGGSNGLRIYDLSSPANPTLVGTWTNRYVHEVTVVTYPSGPYAGKQIAFCCGGFNGGFSQTGVSILDVTNKQSIQVIKHFSYPGAAYCHQCWPSADLKTLYINDELDENGSNQTITKVFDITNLSNPVQKASLVGSTTAIGHNLYVRGDRLFEANYRSGLRVFDISSPWQPVEIGWFDTWPEDDNASFNGLWNNYPFFPSGIVIGSDIEKGLFVWWVGPALVGIDFPGGPPAVFDPAGQQLTVQLTEQAPGTLVPGSAELHVDTGAGWVSTPLTALGGGLYDAPVPATGCGQSVRWYVSARSTNGVTWTEPQGGPLLYHETTAALSEALVLLDDLEVTSGWTVGAFDDTATDGKWQLGDPVGSTAQPEDDHTPGTGTTCWFTRQPLSGGTTAGSHDVDGGKTTLTSPALDLTGTTQPVIAYWRWFSNDKDGVQSSDVFRVEVASSPFGPWVEVESVGPTGPEALTGWHQHQFRVSDFVAASPTVHVRFIASDEGADSLIEAAVDDLRVLDVGCPPGSTTVYCVAKPTSQGCVPHVAAAGTPSASSGAPFDVTASGLINNKNGLLFYGFAPAALPFQAGTICVGAPVTRTPYQSSGGNSPPDDCSGAYAFDFNAWIQSGADPALVPGAQVYAQFWGRDPADPSGFGSSLTDAVGFSIQP